MWGSGLALTHYKMHGDCAQPRAFRSRPPKRGVQHPLPAKTGFPPPPSVLWGGVVKEKASDSHQQRNPKGQNRRTQQGEAHFLNGQLKTGMDVDDVANDAQKEDSQTEAGKPINEVDLVTFNKTLIDQLRS